MDKPCIEVTTNAGTRRMMLTGKPVTIGRDPANSLAYRDSRLSQFHCVIERWNRTLRLRDLGSTNGTTVNGKRVKSATLQLGDVIGAGPISIKLLMLSVGRRGAKSPRRRSQANATGEDSTLPLQPEPTGADTSADLALNPASPTIDLQASQSVGPKSGASQDGPVTLGGSSGLDSKEVLEAAIRHDATLRQMIQALSTHSPNLATIALINARGQTVHAVNDQNVSDAVRDGNESVLFLRSLLLLCLHIRATDLHIEPKTDTYQIRVRVDGMMVSVLNMHQAIAQRLARVVKVLSDIDITLNQAVQEGHFCANVPQRRIDYRVSFTPAMYGQKLVVRVLDLACAPTRLKHLELPYWMSRDISRVIHQDSGMVLICGPTGSGKTTTLYSLIREIDVSLRNVITIEDPVEYQIEGVTQMPISESQGRSFSNLLRSVLRQDPDVILVGEIRDPETAKIAMQASITGHLVFSTVHAQDAMGTIFRLLDLNVEPYLTASGLNLVLAQRLVRQLCPHCKQAARLTPGQMMHLGKHGIRDVNVAYTPLGCPKCLDTGHIGRKAIFELLTTTDELRDVIQTSSKIQDMRRAIRSTLFSSLRESGYRLVAEGLATMEEIDRVVGGE